jgi:hypothetical protein
VGGGGGGAKNGPERPRNVSRLEGRESEDQSLIAKYTEKCSNQETRSRRSHGTIFRYVLE